ncbi:unnamed protein product [Polarella glacialis]|uniref:Uncharacterized protein n=1 Tax=Polarella glacialis TaxID=89957 RepID=A0A813KB01_POLGL|nr:unnamed protein product [Polarella glacialis]
MRPFQVGKADRTMSQDSASTASTDEENNAGGVAAATCTSKNNNDNDKHSQRSARPSRSCCCGTAVWAGVRGASTSALVCVFVALAMDYPPFLSGEQTSWIFCSAMLISFAAQLMKGLDRAIGTLVGAAVAWVGVLSNFVCHASSVLVCHSLRIYATSILLPLITGLAFFLDGHLIQRSSFFKVHRYAFQIGIVTMGIVMITSEGDLYQTGVCRCIEIAIGVILVFIVLLLCSPGSASSVMHSDLIEIARRQALLIQQVFGARIRASPRLSLTQHHLSEFKVDDDIRLNYQRVRELVNKLKSLLPFTAWEPRILNPRYLRSVGRVVVRNHCRLLLARFTNMSAVIVAMDTQLRSLATLPQIDPLLAEEATNLVQVVAELLLHGADRLQAASPSSKQPQQQQQQQQQQQHRCLVLLKVIFVILLLVLFFNLLVVGFDVI